MRRLLGRGRLLLLAVAALVAALVAVLVVGPWGWGAGIEVHHGPALEPASARPPSSGTGSDSTPRFDVTATVRSDHSVEITEDIEQWFAVDRHGIERDIPLRDDAGTHAMRSLTVATDPGTPDAVELLDGGSFDGVTVRIGAADRTITGLHRYRLTYVLENVVTVVDPGALGGTMIARPGETGTAPTLPPAAPAERVALDAFTEWRQPVGSSTYTLVGPSGARDQACVQGRVFEDGPCAAVVAAADGATFTATTPLSPSEGYTVQVDWPAGTFGAVVDHGPQRGPWSLRLLGPAEPADWPPDNTRPGSGRAGRRG